MWLLVRWGGVEPPRLAAHGPQPCLSANSSTSANPKAIIIVESCMSSMKENSMRAIALDAMGSDSFPEPEIQAALEASLFLGRKIILVGDEKMLSPSIDFGIYKNVEIAHAPELVEMWEKPVESAKSKPNNSMAIGIRLIKEKKANAFITAGNTGGAMFNALKELGRIKGVQRPALPGIFPTRNGKCVVLDIGANVDCRPDFLLQFAIMGSVYAKTLLGIKNPRIGLLSNGEEPGKGTQLIKETFSLLEKSKSNFIGNVEPKEIFNGEVDVAITDGFTGNVLVKGSEAVAKLITDVLKEQLMSSIRTKIGALLAKNAFMEIKRLIDPEEIGAAPLLGVDGLVFVAHGRSNAKALISALKLADQSIKTNMLSKLSKAIQNRIM